MSVIGVAKKKPRESQLHNNKTNQAHISLIIASFIYLLFSLLFISINLCVSNCNFF